MSIPSIIFLSFKEEFAKTNINIFQRTKEELTKPFEKAASLVKQTGLELESIDIRTIPSVHNESWQKEKGNRKEHAKQVVAAIREWSNYTFMAGLH